MATVSLAFSGHNQFWEPASKVYAGRPPETSTRQEKVSLSTYSISPDATQCSRKCLQVVGVLARLQLRVVEASLHLVCDISASRCQHAGAGGCHNHEPSELHVEELDPVRGEWRGFLDMFSVSGGANAMK